jgi:hypothetical protein
MPKPRWIPRRHACRCAALLLPGSVLFGMAAAGHPDTRQAVGWSIPHSVPLEARRRAAGTCDGFNLELQNAAGIMRRVGAHAEAERLLGQQRDCGQAPAEIRSAAPVGFWESRLRTLPLRP